MTPTLAGRIQTRLFLLAVVGGVWTALIVPLLAAWIDAPAGDVFRLAVIALVVVAVVGIAWEIVYQAIQEYRWEKDWPALFGLLTGINEFVTTVVVLRLLGEDVNRAVVVHFWSLWLVVWFVANGPFRVVFLRWRFRGGRLA